jgi:hypothetical protein
MSYSASDLQSDVSALLTELGYEFTDHNLEGEGDDEQGGWSWTFGDAWASERFEESGEAEMDALRDYVRRAEELKHAAAKVLSRRQKGDLAEAARELQNDLDACVQGDVEKFITDHA